MGKNKFTNIPVIKAVNKVEIRLNPIIKYIGTLNNKEDIKKIKFFFCNLNLV